MRKADDVMGCSNVPASASTASTEHVGAIQNKLDALDRQVTVLQKQLSKLRLCARDTDSGRESLD